MKAHNLNLKCIINMQGSRPKSSTGGTGATNSFCHSPFSVLSSQYWPVLDATYRPSVRTHLKDELTLNTLLNGFICTFLWYQRQPLDVSILTDQLFAHLPLLYLKSLPTNNCRLLISLYIPVPIDYSLFICPHSQTVSVWLLVLPPVHMSVPHTILSVPVCSRAWSGPSSVDPTTPTCRPLSARSLAGGTGDTSASEVSHLSWRQFPWNRYCVYQVWYYNICDDIHYKVFCYFLLYLNIALSTF